MESILRKRSITPATTCRPPNLKSSARATRCAARSPHCSRCSLNWKRPELRRPFNGVVSQRYVRLGQYVNIGDKLFQVTGTSPMEVRFTLPERDISDCQTRRSRHGLSDSRFHSNHHSVRHPAESSRRSWQRNHRGDGEAHAQYSRPPARNGGLDPGFAHAMNLAEALNAALPELPAAGPTRVIQRLDPGLIANENIEDGQPVIVAMIRGRSQGVRIRPGAMAGHRAVRRQALLARCRGSRMPNLRVRYDARTPRLTSRLDALGLLVQDATGEKHRAAQKSSRQAVTPRPSQVEMGRHRAHAVFRVGSGKLLRPHLSVFEMDLQSLVRRVLTAALFVFMIWIFVANWAQIGGDTLAVLQLLAKKCRRSCRVLGPLSDPRLLPRVGPRPHLQTLWR